MNRKIALILCLGALLAISVGHRGFAQTKPAGRASSADSGPKVENPTYKAWAQFKPGTAVTMKGTTHANGQDIDVESTQKLLELTDDHAVVEISTVAGANGTNMPQPSRKMDITKMVTKSDLDKPGKGFDPDLLAKATEESVTVPAGTFKAKMIEFSKSQQGMNMKVKSWFCDEVPGGTVKQELSGQGNQNGMDVTVETKMELTTIDKK